MKERLFSSGMCGALIVPWIGRERAFDVEVLGRKDKVFLGFRMFTRDGMF